MVNYLNVGCGNKFHKDWVNIDMVSHSPYVRKVNLLKGIPYPDNTFDVVYHSQVLEHIPIDNAAVFINECRRVLKPGGILRIVVPDLENVTREYLRILEENLDKPSAEAAANHYWILLELFDQFSRNKSGGKMKEYLSQKNIPNQNYLEERSGFIANKLMKEGNTGGAANTKEKIKKAFTSWSAFTFAVSFVTDKVLQKLHLKSKARVVGEFRLGGEIHLWMYDRFSLPHLLKSCGFSDISVKDAFTSEIADWSLYELDVKNGQVFDKTSIFVEGVK
jgi:predicted SAM-dependent methyltransferase